MTRSSTTSRRNSSPKARCRNENVAANLGRVYVSLRETKDTHVRTHTVAPPDRRNALTLSRRGSRSLRESVQARARGPPTSRAAAGIPIQLPCRRSTSPAYRAHRGHCVLSEARYFNDFCGEARERGAQTFLAANRLSPWLVRLVYPSAQAVTESRSHSLPTCLLGPTLASLCAYMAVA